MDALQREPLPWFKFPSEELREQHSEKRAEINLLPATPAETFYNAIADKAVVEDLKASIRPHSYGSFWSGVSYACWDACPATYIICEQDNAIPLDAQRGMCDQVDASGQVGGKEGGKINRMVLEKADHSPFWSMTEDLGVAVRKCAGEEV